MAFGAGCGGRERDGEGDLCTRDEAIFGGGDGPDYLGLSAAAQRAVVSVQLANSQGDLLSPCSGVVVGEHWVLTAKHCAEPGAAKGAVVSFGDQAECAEAQLGAQRVLMHDELDLIAIELDTSVSELSMEVAPLAVSLAAPEHIAVGNLVLLAGYGYDLHGRLGQRALLAEPVAAVTNNAIEVDGMGFTGACGGDSGGPLLHRDPATGAAVVLGVLSRGSASCLGRDEYVRLDRAREWLVALGIVTRSTPAPCDAIDEVGRCFGQLAVHCGQGSLRSRLCATGERCAFSTEVQRYDCVSTAVGPCADYDQVGRCEDGAARFCDAGALRILACEAGAERCTRGYVDGVARCVATSVP